MAAHISRESLQIALWAACKSAECDLEKALAWPAFRIALQNTALVMDQINQRQAAHRPIFDAKRAAAGDSD
ncbi:hypothetical protein [Bordetella genomosp. 11]|uniref:Uncharacterized protein n=1 Tax=Bordetella genomosp. 11 TaxID=1416808 RepID=A0A261UKZ3_9BORD|nr:hypothetical protein [Bordetella genomosp. 11]OZI61583.1 hypothetical protein CAL28_20075 [Bordetella genomosp. 11]